MRFLLGKFGFLLSILFFTFFVITVEDVSGHVGIHSCAGNAGACRAFCSIPLEMEDVAGSANDCVPLGHPGLNTCCIAGAGAETCNGGVGTCRLGDPGPSACGLFGAEVPFPPHTDCAGVSAGDPLGIVNACCAMPTLTPTPSNTPTPTPTTNPAIPTPTPPTDCTAANPLLEPGCILPELPLLAVLVLNIVMFSGGALVLIMILYGGFLYASSRSNRQAMQQAREVIKWAAIGALATGSVWLLIQLLTAVFNVPI